MYVTVSHFLPCLTFARLRAPLRLASALPPNSGQECKQLTIPDILAYFDTLLVTVVKCFKAQALAVANVIKLNYVDIGESTKEYTISRLC